MRRTILAATAALALAATGCGSDDGAGVRNDDGGGSISGSASGLSGSGAASGGAECEPGDTSGADTTVEVALTEWDVAPVPDEVAAGTIAFDASTVDAAEPHELVIVKGDDPQALPTGEDGAVDESQLEDGALIGEIEAFPSGETCSAAFDLEPGEYVLFCNIVETEDDGSTESHYAQGMTTSFTVTQ